MNEDYNAQQALVAEIRRGADLAKILQDCDNRQYANACAGVIIDLNNQDGGLAAERIHAIIDSLDGVSSELLRTVCIGTLWREDLSWLSEKDSAGITSREKLLGWVSKDRPKSLPPVFWRAVADRGPRYIRIAFDATRGTHQEEAARLLVRLSHAAVQERITLDIRSTVDSFLDGVDSSVRTAFLNAVQSLPQLDKRKLMTHLDMSLLSELDKSAIEHRGKAFFYDEEAEANKRASKGKDIFAEVARRLERGEKKD